MLMFMVTKVLTRLPSFMRAVRTRNTPGKLERQRDYEQLEKSFDHVPIITCFIRDNCTGAPKHVITSLGPPGNLL